MTNEDIAHAIRCMGTQQRAYFMVDLASALAGDHYSPGDDRILDIVLNALVFDPNDRSKALL